MKTAIIISGQPHGNSTLGLALSGDDLLEIKKGWFNSLRYIYKTRKAAIKALSAAYQHLKREEPDIVGQFGGIRYVRERVLYYDASEARIEQRNY